MYLQSCVKSFFGKTISAVFGMIFHLSSAKFLPFFTAGKRKKNLEKGFERAPLSFIMCKKWISLA